MSTALLADTYRLIAELLLHPDDRDEARITALGPAPRGTRPLDSVPDEPGIRARA